MKVRHAGNPGPWACVFDWTRQDASGLCHHKNINFELVYFIVNLELFI